MIKPISNGISNDVFTPIPENRLDAFLDKYSPQEPKAPQSEGESERRKRESLLNRLALLGRREAKRAAIDSWRLDRAAFDNLFPMKAVPEEIRPIVEGIADAAHTPLGASCATLLTVEGGSIGKDKAQIFTQNGPVFALPPMVSTILTGPSGCGKTALAEFYIDPLSKYEIEAKAERTRQRGRKSATNRELEELNKNADANEEKIKRLLNILDFVNIGDPAYCTDYKSIEAIQKYAVANRLYAMIKGRIQDGYILHRGNAGGFFYRGFSPSDIEKTLELWSKLDEFPDGTSKPSFAVGRPEDDTPMGKVGAAFLFQVQDDCMYCLNVDPLQGNGLINRCLITYIPKYKTEQDPKSIDSWGLADQWGRIVDFIHNFQGAPFCFDCKQELDQYSERLGTLSEIAEQNGDKLQTVFLDKLFGITCRIAFNLHFLKLAIEGTPLVYPGGLPVVPRRIDFSTAPSWTKIDAQTFNEAVDLAEYYRKTRPDIVAFLQENVKPKGVSMTRPRRDDFNGENDATEKPLPSKVASLYRWIFDTHEDKEGRVVDNAEPYDLLKPGDGRGRVISVTELRKKNYYKEEATRPIFESELESRALMYRLPSAGGNDKGKRVFIPDDITLEELEQWRDGLGIDFAQELEEVA